MGTRAPASQAQDCGHPGLGSGLATYPQGGFDSGRSFVAARLNQLHPRPPNASPPDGNASPTAKRQRYSASTRPQGKRNQLQPLDGRPGLRSGLLASCQSGFDTGRSFVAARLNQLHPRPPNASPPVIRQSSRRERQPNRQTPALQRKHTTTRQANPAPGPRTHQTPAFPSSAGLPAIRQPNRRTPALQRKHTTARQARPASGTAVSTRAARSSRPGSTSFGGRDSPSYPR